jgi:50S ribosomal subunit-associated GTPase HflX
LFGKSNIATKTQGNAIFISAIKKRNIDDLRKKIMNKVRALYKIRYPLQGGSFLIEILIFAAPIPIAIGKIPA